MMCSGPTDTTRPNPDTLAPLVDGNVLSVDDSITSVLGAHIFLPSDTLAFQVMAQDNVALEWIGFRFSGAATLSDSILVPDSLRSKTVGVTVRVIPAQGASGLLTVTGFGRDTSTVLLRKESGTRIDRKSTRLNSSHTVISYAVFCLK